MCRQQFDKAGLKFMTVVLAALYVVAGLVTLGFGISIKATPHNFQSHYDYTGLDLRIVRGDILEKSAVFLIVVACFSILAGVYIIYAVVSENASSLKICSIVLVFLILINIIMIIFAAAYPPKELMKEQMRLTFLKDFQTQDVKTNGSMITSFPDEKTEPFAWAYTQINTRCCGVDGPDDYGTIPTQNRTEKVPNRNETVLPVPLSCCKLEEDVTKLRFTNLDGCIEHDLNVTNQKGCYKSVMVYYTLSALTVFRLAPILMAFEIGLIGFLLKLAYDLNNYQSME